MKRPAPRRPGGPSSGKHDCTTTSDYVDYTVNVDPVNGLFQGVAEVLKASLRWFNRSGHVVFIHPTHGLKLVTTATLNGYLSHFVEIRFWFKDRRKLLFRRHGLLPRDLIGPFIQAPQVAELLYPLQRYTRSPLFDADWHLANEPGYNANARTYYDGPILTPARGTPLLTALLAEFCWKTPIDRVNFIGALLTGVTIPHWPGKHPLVVLNANLNGLGKTLLARVMASILDGEEHLIGFHADEEEFEKQLATGIEAGNRVLVVDNVRCSRGVREIASGVLERCVTAVTLMFRRLGTNATIQRPNDVLFALTMQSARLSSDLRRRALPVNLYYEGDPRTRTFSMNQLQEFVRQRREDILAELLGMVERWLVAGRPMHTPAVQHSVSNEWAATIDAILCFNGLEGFLSNFDESISEADPDYHALVDMCESSHDEPRMSALAWARLACERGVLQEQLFDAATGFPKPEHGQATIIGTLFTRYVDRLLVCPSGAFWLRATDRGKSHASVEYWFQRVTDGSVGAARSS
jgi:hypothetical protein